MSTLELKQKLINKIQLTDSRTVLYELNTLLEVDMGEVEPYQMSEAQVQAVHEARVQIKNGQFLTNEQADKTTDEWLNK
ncbi:MAG: hypothetical protein HYZ34_15155 [Ignavibacteriae bacterium]|nr:hypothetical protein [Ignavibacteriota bacterium]